MIRIGTIPPRSLVKPETSIKRYLQVRAGAPTLQVGDMLLPCLQQEVVELYFQDSGTKLENLTAKLADARPDYAEIDALVHQFKGSSASFGAHAIAQMCVQVHLCPNEAIS